MSVRAAIGKSLLSDAMSSSVYFDQGEKLCDVGLFVQHLGNAILEEYSGIRLIGEIERTEARDTYETLRGLLSAILDKPMLRAVLQEGTRQWRAILSLYFVWAGIFSYGEDSGHDLWPPVFRGLGIEHDTNLSWRCGQLFMECLQENDLERFDGLDVGHPYMNRILLHGLIPERHIDRFVRELIEAELQSHLGRYATGNFVINKWTRSDALQYLPKPIRRFVEYGKPVNVDVVERFLEMARRWYDDEPELWRQWGLPQYMVMAFRRHVEGNGTAQRLKKLAGHSPKERPSVCFDLERSDLPFLHVPRQRTRFEILIRLCWEDFRQKRHEKEHRPTTTPVGDWFHSEPQELNIFPSFEGWSLQVCKTSGEASYEQKVEVDFPLTESGEPIPLMFFSRSTGKLITANGKSDLPESVLVIHPHGSILEWEGGRQETEPEKLFGGWKGWCYVLCTLADDTVLHYCGPDINLNKEVYGTIRLSGKISKQVPSLGDRGKAPPWMKSLEGSPIYTNWQDITIECPEDAYPLWRNAFATLTRLDQTTKAKAIELRFQRTGNVFSARLPLSAELAPGVYEVQLRGALGLDAAVLPFIYLPVDKAELVVADQGDQLASEFQLHMKHDIEVQPLLYTSLSRQDKTLAVSIGNDQGEAYCAVKLFMDSANPTTILLSRSAIRWSRRAECGLFQWDVWRARPEEFPIQRVEELKDARVTIQLDEPSRPTKRVSGNKLKIVLKTSKESRFEERVLMSYDAPTVRRGVQDTWIIDLKPFCDHLKSIPDIESAMLLARSNGGSDDVVLFVLQRYPEFKGFQVIQTQRTKSFDRLQIDWSAHANDPSVGRILRLFPADTPSQCKSFPLKDRTDPPFNIEVQMPTAAGLWTAQVDIDRSRFGLSTARPLTSKSVCTWFRWPAAWADWLEWPEISPQETMERVGSLRALDEKTLRTTLPLVDFLQHFHFGKGESTFSALQSMLGASVIVSLLPYSAGSTWEVKTPSGINATLQVIQSSCDQSGLRDALKDRHPNQCYELPGVIELDLCLRHYHSLLGKAGSIWRCLKSSAEELPSMESEDAGILDLSIWIGDAAHPSSQGRLVAKCELQECWEDPPWLPILDPVPHKDVLLFDSEHDDPCFEKGAVRAKPTCKGLSTLGEYLGQKTTRDLTRKFVDGSNTESWKQGESLSKRWIKWSELHGINPFLKRMIVGRIRRAGANGLSGTVALAARLKSHGLWHEPAAGTTFCSDPASGNLYNNTLEFVRRHSPRSFLRDLVLSEIIISWYWNKAIATS